MAEGSTLQENLIPDVCVPTTVRLKFLTKKPQNT